MINKAFERLLDKVIPSKKILSDIRHYIKEECHYDLHIDEPVRLSHDTNYYLNTRAFVQASHPDFLPCDHLVAEVYLGTEQEGEDVLPLFGIMRMYYDLNGNFIKEERLNVWGEKVS